MVIIIVDIQGEIGLSGQQHTLNIHPPPPPPTDTSIFTQIKPITDTNTFTPVKNTIEIEHTNQSKLAEKNNLKNASDSKKV